MKLSIKIKSFLTLALTFSIFSCAQQTETKTAPIFKDGEAQIVEAFSNPEYWVRHDLWVETEFGDRLDLLSNQFYDDVTLYWIIAIANPNKVNMGSLFLPPGTQIRIPVGVISIVDSYNILNK